MVTASSVPLHPAQPSHKRTGRLLYRGGLVLSSPDKRFGGLSDLIVSAEGSRLLAVADTSYWFKASLTYDSRGDLSGLANTVMTSMRGLDGKPLKGKAGDAEGLTADVPGQPDGIVFVSFEGDSRIWRYDVSKSLSAVPSEIPIGDWAKTLPGNGGMEALVRLPSGGLLALSEYGESPGGGFIGAIENRGTEILSVVERPPFRSTSAAVSGDDILLLERRFSMLGGMGTGIRRIPLRIVQGGARLDGEVIADLSYQDANIDNMEGIAVRTGPKGETLIYLISDDNYSPLQRTMLLMFELVQ
jgi:hypothetical protein